MRTLYAIDEDIMSCIDPETGEIDEARWDALTMERDEKVERILLLMKNKTAMAKAIKDERDAFDARYKSLTAEIDRLRNWITVTVLKGENFETSKVKASWRRTKAVEILDEEVLPDKWCTFKVERKPNKADIKDALILGEDVPGAVLKENLNLTVK